MAEIPIVAHHRPQASDAEVARAAERARRLRRAEPDDEFLRDSMVRRWQPAPTLHLDDLSSVTLLDRFFDFHFAEDRARLRAGDGDLVASCTKPVAGFEDYCRDRLGLGDPEWLRPQPGANALEVASACWIDGEVRARLLAEIRAAGSLLIHPHMGNDPVWELAYRLHGDSGRPVRVIAPPPSLTRKVNDKIWFARTTTALLGPRYIPRTAVAANLGELTRQVRDLAEGSRLIVVKVPDSAGGAGNLVVEAERLRGRSLDEVRKILQDLGGPLWVGRSSLLVGCWEEAVLTAPSAQLWVPPPAEGPPVVEGLFEQIIEGREGIFVGSRPAAFPSDLTQELVDRCWLLTLFYQHLGYVGRCSFDMILVGRDLATCRLELVECNGRWGGTSGPMTLMNRLFGDWWEQPYAVRELCAEGLEHVELAALLDHFSDDLYDARTGSGRLLFYNPGALESFSGIDVLAVAPSLREAESTVSEEVPRRLRELAAEAEHQAG